MVPLPYVWPYALIFWGVFVWAFIPEMGIIRRARRTQGPTDSKSIQVITAVGSVGFFVAFPLAWLPALQVAASYRVAAFVAGVVLLAGGSLLRRHCWRMLGASFTGDVQVRPDQQIVERGAYRLVRHPSYTAGILMNVGVGIAVGSWASALILLVASVAAYGYRMRVEERALLAGIGEPYARFMQSRKRLLPFVY
ncbi:MAG: methyltransferase family protein [Gemmatimonadaceae bacterium]